MSVHQMFDSKWRDNLKNSRFSGRIHIGGETCVESAPLRVIDADAVKWTSGGSRISQRGCQLQGVGANLLFGQFSP